MNGLLRRLLGIPDKDSVKGPETPLTYEQARVLANHQDPEVRRQLAARDDIVPEILYFLAEDPVPAVRRQIAANPAAPPQADLLLAADGDEDVRARLAEKVGRMVPGLTPDEQDRLRRLTYDTLSLLTRDQIVRVRAILAEALKDVANAPREVVRTLAGDSELVVARPVLECSPVLTDDDLMEIIHSNPIQGALSAISRRVPVRARVADAIATTDDVEAITELLANGSAQVREETLDRLIDRAPDIEAWHGPLVRRPQLSARAAARLARFVAENLISELNQRADLDDEIKRAVAATVRRRLDREVTAATGKLAPAQAAQATQWRATVAARPGGPPEAPLDLATRLHQAGRLTEPLVQGALTAGDGEFVMAALAVLAGVPPTLVAKVADTHSAKGAVALVWKAALSPVFAAQLQTRLLHIPPADVLRPRPDNRFALAPEDMQWQLDFLGSMTG